MNRNYLMLIASACIALFSLVLDASHLFNSNPQGKSLIMELPKPKLKGAVSLEECLHTRRSVRTYDPAPLSLEEASQLLWSAQGITADSFYRTAPSAGALYPLEIYLIAGSVTGLKPGVYYYRPADHSLEMKMTGDRREAVAKASWEQSMLAEAPASILITAVFSRVTRKYGDRGNTYVYMEAGHAGQNIYLQAAALGCGTVAVGAFDDAKIKETCRLPEEQIPLYLFPVGKLRR